MTKSSKIGKQIYGYTVCLVAVITFLIAVTWLVNAVIDLKDPLHSHWSQSDSPSLASFENYKVDVLRSLPKNESNALYMPNEQTLHSMYEAAKSDKIETAEHQSNRSLFIGGLLLFVSVSLFLVHWKWVQKDNTTVIIQESNMSYAD